MDETPVEKEYEDFTEDFDDLFQKISVPVELKLEPRPMFLKLGAVSSVKGSAYMEYGNTKVVVVVEPPRELTNQQRNIEIPCVVSCLTTFVPSAFEDATRLSHKQDMLSISLKKVLESAICRYKFSNVQLDVKITVLEDDGCALSTAINCCGAALVVAGIPTYDIITASTICLYKGIEFVNPNADIEKLFSSVNDKTKDFKDYGIMTTASFPTLLQVTGCFQRGMLSKTSFARLLTSSLQINERLSYSLKQIFLENVQKTIALNGNS